MGSNVRSSWTLWSTCGQYLIVPQQSESQLDPACRVPDSFLVANLDSWLRSSLSVLENMYAAVEGDVLLTPVHVGVREHHQRVKSRLTRAFRSGELLAFQLPLRPRANLTPTTETMHRVIDQTTPPYAQPSLDCKYTPTLRLDFLPDWANDTLKEVTHPNIPPSPEVLPADFIPNRTPADAPEIHQIHPSVSWEFPETWWKK